MEEAERERRRMPENEEKMDDFKLPEAENPEERYVADSEEDSINALKEGPQETVITKT